MFCPNCGAEINEDAKFCASCGKAVESAAQPQPEFQQAPPQQEYQYQQAPPQQEYQYQQTPPAQPAYPPYQQTPSPATKNKLVAGLLAIFLGTLGIHKFYLGYTKPAVIMLLVAVLGSILTFGVAAVVMEVIGIIEGIMYLTKSDEEFFNIYEANQKEWF